MIVNILIITLCVKNIHNNEIIVPNKNRIEIEKQKLEEEQKKLYNLIK